MSHGHQGNIADIPLAVPLKFDCAMVQKKFSLHIEYCQGGPFADKTCEYISAFDTNTDCMDTTLECVYSYWKSWCSVFFNGAIHYCAFNGVNVPSQPIRCCLCENSINNTTQLWWDCDGTTSTVSQSQTSLSPSLSTGECTNPVSGNLIGQ